MDTRKRVDSKVSQIILDAEISFGLQACLIKENLARPRSDDWITREVTRRGSRRSRQALEYLLLYEQVLIPARSSQVDLLGDATEFCTIIPDDSKWWKRPEWMDWGVEYFMTIKSGKYKPYVSDPSEISIFKAFTKRDISYLKSIRLFLLPYLRTRPSSFVLPVSSDFFDTVIGIINGDPFERHFWSEIGKHPERDRFAWELKLYAHRIFEELKELEWLMSKSASLGIPVATPRVKIPRVKVQKGAALENDILFDPNYLRAYQIYHSEIEVFPELRTIKDVLRLRRKPEISQFRDCLMEWATCLRASDYDAEKEMRQEIRRATHELKRLGPVRKVGWWSTVMSLPVGIAELLVGSIGIGGLVLASIGTACLARSEKIKKKHGWLLIGN